MAQLVEGEKRLKEEFVRRGETADQHPFFDFKSAAVDRIADNEFRRAGYATPIENLTDEAALNAIGGVMVGLMTDMISNRTDFMVNAYNEGMKYLKRVGDGEIKLEIDEIETEPDEEQNASAEGYRADEAVFDDADPYALGAGVFPPLRAPRGLRGRW